MCVTGRNKKEGASDALLSDSGSSGGLVPMGKLACYDIGVGIPHISKWVVDICR